MALSEYSVTIEVRTTPRLLWILVDLTDDPKEKQRLAALGRWEMRIDNGDWQPFELWDTN